MTAVGPESRGSKAWLAGETAIDVGGEVEEVGAVKVRQPSYISDNRATILTKGIYAVIKEERVQNSTDYFLVVVYGHSSQRVDYIADRVARDRMYDLLVRELTS